MACEFCASSLIAPVVTSLVVMCGWLFVRKDNNERERRKELRSQIDIASKEADEISKIAFMLLRHSGDDERASIRQEQIICQIKVLGARLAMIARTYPNFSASKELIAFRQAITGSQSGFDDPTRFSLPSNSTVLINVTKQNSYLKVGMEMGYAHLFA